MQKRRDHFVDAAPAVTTVVDFYRILIMARPVLSALYGWIHVIFQQFYKVRLQLSPFYRNGALKTQS